MEETMKTEIDTTDLTDEERLKLNLAGWKVRAPWLIKGSDEHMREVRKIYAYDDEEAYAIWKKGGGDKLSKAELKTWTGK
jgi:hypothetical protein